VNSKQLEEVRRDSRMGRFSGCLVVSNMFGFPFDRWDVIPDPVDELILFKMVLAPPTSW
jgi:hypothetical protein